MIRKFRENDLDNIMSLWLTANIEAHSFIDESYWKNHYDFVKEMIPKAEVFVSESDGTINGFIGLIDHNIAGIFVKNSKRSKGIGTELLNVIKCKRETLHLHVYKHNRRAILFYQNAGFEITAEEIDIDTSEVEYLMTWHQSSLNSKPTTSDKNIS
mgnify:FL=1